MLWQAGTKELTIDEDNFEAVARCHQKYNCPKLDELCRRFMDKAVNHLAKHNAMRILNTTLFFEPVPERAQRKCIVFVARHLTDMAM